MTLPKVYSQRKKLTMFICWGLISPITVAVCRGRTAWFETSVAICSVSSLFVLDLKNLFLGLMERFVLRLPRSETATNNRPTCRGSYNIWFQSRSTLAIFQWILFVESFLSNTISPTEISWTAFPLFLTFDCSRKLVRYSFFYCFVTCCSKFLWSRALLVNDWWVLIISWCAVFCINVTHCP